MESSLPEDQAHRLLHQLFPGGLGDSALLGELAPEGWEASSLRRVFHPTVEQLHAEAVALRAQLQRLSPAGAPAEGSAPPSLDEIRADYQAVPARPREECGDLIGLCLWDILADGHEVVAADGRCVDFGSFRGAAASIAEFRQLGGGSEGGARAGWDYLDFYMGTILVGRRADCTPVYELIFRRMQRLGLDWRYWHPRLGLVDVSGLKDILEEDQTPEWQGYDPSKAIAHEQERRARQQATAELREFLDQAYRESVEEARKQPPPRTVQAYRHIYGRWPEGWPPWEVSRV